MCLSCETAMHSQIPETWQPRLDSAFFHKELQDKVISEQSLKLYISTVLEFRPCVLQTGASVFWPLCVF